MTGTLIATIVPVVLLLGIVALGRGGWRTAPLIAIGLLWGFGSTWLIVDV
ncbi:MAG: hypothetical protein F2795_06385, partial [Actinobacteria bacterium]|nr:hypothetical protein [Actinomycetota bacterium]